MNNRTVVEVVEHNYGAFVFHLFVLSLPTSLFTPCWNILEGKRGVICRVILNILICLKAEVHTCAVHA